MHPFEQSGDILLIARQTVQGLRDDDVKGGVSRVLDQVLISRPNCGRSADGRIAVANGQLARRPGAVVAARDLAFHDAVGSRRLVLRSVA